MSQPLLPSARVHFGPRFHRRVGALAVEVSAARSRVEGAGRARLFGAGFEFVGYRAYRPGEDLRRLDWGLYARLRRPFVRVAAREASENWAILLDTSASMGCGPPGKLQRAAEVATALAALGGRLGAQVRLFTSGTPTALRLRRSAELVAWMGALEGQEAAGDRGIACLLEEGGAWRGAGRLFVLGDFLDLTPPDVARFQRRGRELFLLQILAPQEINPGTLGAAELHAAEDQETLQVRLNSDAVARYEVALEQEQSRWTTSAQRHRAQFGRWSSDTAFERIVVETLGP